MPEDLTRNEGPRYVVELSGQSLTQGEKGLSALVVEDHVDMMGVMRATIAAGSGTEWSAMKLGDAATAGFGGSGDKIFNGFITGLRHHARAGNVEYLTVVAMDPLCKLGASRHTKIYEEQTDSDIVSAVLSAAGLSPGTVDSTSGSNKYVIQRNESDLAFLKRLAARNGYLLLVNGEGKVDFKKVQYSGSPTELGRGDLMEFDYTVTHQAVPPKVTVIGWNYVDKAKVEGQASSIETIGGGSDAIAKTGSIWQEEMFITDVHVADASAAKSMAEGELNRFARSFVRGSAKVSGQGTIKAGTLVKFKEFASGFNPEGYVVSSRHLVEGGVYTTEFQFIGNTEPG
jgi:phage protein D